MALVMETNWYMCVLPGFLAIAASTTFGANYRFTCNAAVAVIRVFEVDGWGSGCGWQELSGNC
jgi:hypothetical protein